MNKPYVKKYKDGILLNPIVGRYVNRFPNRSQRREELRLNAKRVDIS